MPGRTQDALYDQNLTYHGQFRTEGTEFPALDEQRIWKGLISGLAAGLIGTWVMTQYQVNSQAAIQKLRSRHQPAAAEEPPASPTEEQQEPQEAPENPIVAVADRIARRVAGRALPADKKEVAGNLVHYGFGTLIGGLYGVLRELWPPAGAAHGVAYGAVVWASVDEALLPATGLAKWAPEYPAYVHANVLGAHLVYAVTLDSARRLFDPLLDRAVEAVNERRQPRLAEGILNGFPAVERRRTPRVPPSTGARPLEFRQERRKEREPAA
jgi:uncharacterized membrane protein YagU involved in acid resistance